MGKVQTGLLLDEDLRRVIKALEDETGASFTNIVTAAILCFLFGETPMHQAPDTWWMKHVLALKRGELSLHQLPRIVSERNVEDARKLLGLHLGDENTEDPKERAMRILEWFLKKAESKRDDCRLAEGVSSLGTGPGGADPLYYFLQYLRGLGQYRGQFDEELDAPK